MNCEHNDCFTCPYKDCIIITKADETKKRGRKKLPPEEIKRRRKVRSMEYYYSHQDYWHDRYIAKTKNIVAERYKSKLNKENV